MKVFTNKEMLNIPEGTRVRIKATVYCHPKYYAGGKLVIDYDSMEKGDYPFGIQITGFGYCQQFKAADYELI